MPRSSSLLRRFWIASAILLPILMGFSAYVLNRAYVTSLNNAEREAIFAQIYGLMAVAEFDGQSIALPPAMANPRFETPESGLYARVISHDKLTLWQSNSLESSTIGEEPSTTGEESSTIGKKPSTAGEEPSAIKEKYSTIGDAPLTQYGSISATRFVQFGELPAAGQSIDFVSRINGYDHRVLRFGTFWEYDNSDIYYCFEIIHAQHEKNAEIKHYQQALFTWLGGMAVLLLMIQVAIVRWSLQPLRAVANEIKQVEIGQQHELKGRYPKELTPVSESLNTLLKSEQSQRERYKNSLSDLAHSLKTPLAVIRSQLNTDNSREAGIDEQVQRMSNIISHQLVRASAQVKTIFSQGTPVAPMVQRLIAALTKVYHGKNLRFYVDIPIDFQCRIEADDLMEILGNVIDNACKYGSSEVNISSSITQDATEIVIEDDGPGVPNKLKGAILNRGARADTSKIGQGIGLAIAVDILSSYNGALEIERASLGGAAFRIQLPC